MPDWRIFRSVLSKQALSQAMIFLLLILTSCKDKGSENKPYTLGTLDGDNCPSPSFFAGKKTEVITLKKEQITSTPTPQGIPTENSKIPTGRTRLCPEGSNIGKEPYCRKLYCNKSKVSINYNGAVYSHSIQPWLSQIVQPTLANEVVKSPFGCRKLAESTLHYGTDFVAPPKSREEFIGLFPESIYAISAGVVRVIIKDEKLGNIIEIEHPNCITSLYAHTEEVYVRENQKVTTGQKIAKIGATGTGSIGPHLHIETKFNGVAFDMCKAFSEICPKKQGKSSF